MPAPPDRRLALAVGLGLSVSVLFAVLSKGGHHDDDLVHYRCARWAHDIPAHLLGIWARPGLTVPLAAVAWIGDPHDGWLASRLLSALVSAGSALFAGLLARRLGATAWLAAALTWAQPHAFLLSYTTLTENFAAFYLITALWLVVGRRPFWAALALSAAFLTRHEMLALMPAWWVAASQEPGRWLRRVAVAVAPLTLPLVHHGISSLTLGFAPLSLLGSPDGSTDYPPTAPFSYWPKVVEATTIAIATLAVRGLFVSFRRDRWLTATLTILYLGIHGVIVWRGIYASGAFARFAVAAAPAIGVLAALGWRAGGTRALALAALGITGLTAVATAMELDQGRPVPPLLSSPLVLWGGTALVAALVIGSLIRPRAYRWVRVALVCALALPSVVQFALVARPLPATPDQLRIADVVTWMRERELSERPLFATNPWFSHELELVEIPTVHKGKRLLAAMPVGTIVLFDSVYSESDFHQIRELGLRQDPAYRHLASFEPTQPGSVRVEVFEKIAATAVPEAPDRPYPPNIMARWDPPPQSFYLRKP